ncbi:hypothetical protein NDU88_000707 [Pleurodeles waltl]|uniref:Uncharacterized protein n=1 Tax=Pleurodeles waltl TaxID=8319 RepID=A0AAV7LYA0_PLEWA|nr:hypothetical protein NDU88_000707 [Pleurodeles waltl]
MKSSPPEHCVEYRSASRNISSFTVPIKTVSVTKIRNVWPVDNDAQQSTGVTKQSDSWVHAINQKQATHSIKLFPNRFRISVSSRSREPSEHSVLSGIARTLTLLYVGYVKALELNTMGIHNNTKELSLTSMNWQTRSAEGGIDPFEEESLDSETVCYIDFLVFDIDLPPLDAEPAVDSKQEIAKPTLGIVVLDVKRVCIL